MLLLTDPFAIAGRVSGYLAQHAPRVENQVGAFNFNTESRGIDCLNQHVVIAMLWHVKVTVSAKYYRVVHLGEAVPISKLFDQQSSYFRFR